ncbi:MULTISPECIES: hypothetical protein [Nonomuraea]|uniref:GerMN domain-containing protein n=1 Tax=Nonomuraea salmonea TaxID=46181 RepID=A0ABV5P419_9ACTN
MTRTLRRLATALVLVAVAGCGVRPSDVIPVGPPPSGAVAPARATRLYLVKDDQLQAVTRSRGRWHPADVLAVLADGPTAKEQAQGYTTDIPLDAAPFTVVSEPGGRLVVTRLGSSGELSELAVGQIVCTVAALLPGGDGEITVADAEPAVDPRTCPR